MSWPLLNHNHGVINSGTSVDTSGSDLCQAIIRQLPEIFYKLDDTGTPVTVLDIGSKDYSNEVLGSAGITFEETGLVDDGGTAALFGQAVDSAIFINEAIPSSHSHAHVFVLSHDSTASARGLLCSGNHTDAATGGMCFYLELQSDDTERYASHNGTTWEYLDTAAALDSDGAVLVILTLEYDSLDRGIAKIYFDQAQQGIDEDISMPVVTGDNQRQALGGYWSGDESFASVADGVTKDYYAQIAMENFNLDDLFEAAEPSINGPSLTEATLTEVYAHPVANIGVDALVRPAYGGGYAAAGNDTKIMICPEAAPPGLFSNDSGDSWSAITFPDLRSWGSNQRPSALRYDEANDAWYVNMFYTTTDDISLARSDDDGATWTEVDSTHWINEHGFTMVVESDGDITHGGMIVANDPSVKTYTSPELTTGAGSGRTVLTSPANVFQTSSVAGTGYVYVEAQGIFETDYSSHSLLSATVDTYGWATDGITHLLVPKTGMEASGDYYVMEPGETPVIHNESFPTAYISGFAYGNGTYILWWNISTALESKNLYMKTSATGLTGSWSDTITLTLVTDKMTTSGSSNEKRMMNMDYMGGGIWVLSYLSIAEKLIIGLFSLDGYSTPTVPPEPGPVTDDDLLFLSHADSVSGPYYDYPAYPEFQTFHLVNSAPNSNTIATQVESGIIDTTDPKFGAGAGTAPAHSKTAGVEPWNVAYWAEAEEFTIGYRRFTYDIQIKADLANGYCFPGSSQGARRRSGTWYSFGGIKIILMEEPGDSTLGRIEVYVGPSFTDALAGAGDQLIMQFPAIPGYLTGDYNHVAVARSFSGSSSTEQYWRIFLNGNAAPSQVVLKGSATSAYIYPGTAWMLGSAVHIYDAGKSISRYTPAAKWDEARLIIDKAVYTVPFVPPTSAHEPS